jgi:hypothetical protein
MADVNAANAPLKDSNVRSLLGSLMVSVPGVRSCCRSNRKQNGNNLEGIRQSYAPVGEVEECLVHLIAYQFWRWIARLLPYERDLSFNKMTTPGDDLLGEGCSSADIQKVLNTPAGGDALWLNGELSETIQDPSGGACHLLDPAPRL